MLADYEGPDKGCTWQQAWEGMVQVFRENPEKVRAIGTANPRLCPPPPLNLTRCLKLLGSLPAQSPRP